MIRKTLLLALLLWPFAVAAGEPPAVTAALARLEREAATVRTLSSDFVQEKHLAMFDEVLVSKGRFAFAKPESLRWELLEPVATGFVLTGGKGRRWNDRSGKSEPFVLEREPVMKVVAEQLLAWAKADFVKLRRDYAITLEKEQPTTLRLTPLVAGGVIKHLLIAFAADGSHVTLVEIHDQDGDFTRIRFVNARVNPDLPESLF